MATTQTRDAVIIGGGHNGLVCAFYLAKAGLNLDGKAPEFKPFEGNLDDMALGADDSLLLVKIMDDQIKLEVEKLKANSAPPTEKK